MFKTETEAAEYAQKYNEWSGIDGANINTCTIEEANVYCYMYDIDILTYKA